MGNLTALAVKNAKPGDKLSDGGGLRLDVDKNGNRSWVFRYTSPTTGKERYAGFGSAAEVSLADAPGIGLSPHSRSFEPRHVRHFKSTTWTAGRLGLPAAP